MKRNKLAVTMLAVMLVLGMGVGTAWSYFTDSTTAEGSVSVHVKPTTTITEENGPGTKTIRIRNTSENVPVYVRARVYAADELGANASGSGWSGSIDAWYDYDEPLAVGSETQPLNVSFALKHEARDGDETNVIVVYECVPVTYDADHNPLPASWND